MIQEFMSLFERYVVAAEQLVVETRESNNLNRNILSVRQSLVGTAEDAGVVETRTAVAAEGTTETAPKVTKKVTKPKSTPAPEPEPEPEAAEEAAAEEEEEEEADPDDPPAATIEDITAAVETYYEADGSLGRKERKAGFVALRSKYEIATIKDLPANKIAAFLRDVKALPVK